MTIRTLNNQSNIEFAVCVVCKHKFPRKIKKTSCRLTSKIRRAGSVTCSRECTKEYKNNYHKSKKCKAYSKAYQKTDKRKAYAKAYYKVYYQNKKKETK